MGKGVIKLVIAAVVGIAIYKMVPAVKKLFGFIPEKN